MTTCTVYSVVQQYVRVDYCCFRLTSGASTVLVAPVAQRYHVTSDTLGREFDPGKRDFSH